jgi:hypothetical protein
VTASGPARSWALAAAGAVLCAATAIHALLLPLTPGRMARPSAELIERLALWSFLERTFRDRLANAELVSFVLLLSAVAAFAAYAAAVGLVWGRQSSRGTRAGVWAVSLACAAISFAALPNSSTDVFNYAARGRLAAIHGENPYRVPVDAVPDDPIYPYASHRYTAQPGGKLPVWMAVDVVLARIAGDDPLAVLFVYRATLTLFHIASLCLLAALTRAPGSRGMEAAVVTYGWNPVVLVFFSCKTDTLAVLLLLAGAWCIVRERRGLCAGFLAASSMVKPLAAPFLAVVLGQELRARSRRAGVAALAIGAASTALVGWAYGANIIGVVRAHLPGRGSEPLLLLAAAGFCALIAVFALRTDRAAAPTLRAWAVLALWQAALLTKPTFAWYLLTLVAVASVVVDSRITLATVLLTFSSFLVNRWTTISAEGFPLPHTLALAEGVTREMFLLTAAIAAGLGLWLRSRLRAAAAAERP